MKGHKNWILNKLIPSLLFIGSIVFSIKYGNQKRKELDNNALYTIGITLKTYWTKASGKWIIYTYYVQGIQYTGNSRYIESTKVPGGYYYVKFNSEEVDVSILIKEKEVSDSIREIKNPVWRELPE